MGQVFVKWLTVHISVALAVDLVSYCSCKSQAIL